MKTLEIQKATKALAEYAVSINDGSLLVVKNGKPLAILSSARGMDAESIALANNPKFSAIIEKSRARQKTEGGLTIEQVRQQLGIATKQKKRRS